MGEGMGGVHGHEIGLDRTDHTTEGCRSREPAAKVHRARVYALLTRMLQPRGTRTPHDHVWTRILAHQVEQLRLPAPKASLRVDVEDAHAAQSVTARARSSTSHGMPSTTG